MSVVGLNSSCTGELGEVSEDDRSSLAVGLLTVGGTDAGADIAAAWDKGMFDSTTIAKGIATITKKVAR